MLCLWRVILIFYICHAPLHRSQLFNKIQTTWQVLRTAESNSLWFGIGRAISWIIFMFFFKSFFDFFFFHSFLFGCGLKLSRCCYVNNHLVICWFSRTVNDHSLSTIAINEILIILLIFTKLLLSRLLYWFCNCSMTLSVFFLCT